METIEKGYFEEKERVLWDIRYNKERLLLFSGNYDEFIGLFKEAEAKIHSLQESEILLKSHRRKEHLWKLLSESEREFEKNKRKRTRLTILGFHLMFLFASFFTSQTLLLTEHSEWGELVLLFLVLIIPSFIVAFIHFWVNAIIFSQVFQKSQDETEYLKHLKDDIRKLEEQIAGRKCPTEQSLEESKKSIEEIENRLKTF